jgi:hypothetical protein
MSIPEDAFLTEFAQQRIVLTPEKFGVMGQYSRELLEVSVAEDMTGYMMDTLLMRLTTSVLCGQTISENPQVELAMPASWWQHFKCATGDRAGQFDLGFSDRKKWKLWLWFPYALVFCVLWLLDKRPVKWDKYTADVHFEQRVLYPEVNVPASVGRQVIYETVSMNLAPMAPWGSRLLDDPSRFLSRHEIVNAVYADADATSYGQPWSPHATLNWLEQHGVNVDQLVKRQ